MPIAKWLGTRGAQNTYFLMFSATTSLLNTPFPTLIAQQPEKDARPNKLYLELSFALRGLYLRLLASGLPSGTQFFTLSNR